MTHLGSVGVLVFGVQAWHHYVSFSKRLKPTSGTATGCHLEHVELIGIDVDKRVQNDATGACSRVESRQAPLNAVITHAS